MTADEARAAAPRADVEKMVSAALKLIKTVIPYGKSDIEISHGWFNNYVLAQDRFRNHAAEGLAEALKKLGYKVTTYENTWGQYSLWIDWSPVP